MSGLGMRDPRRDPVVQGSTKPPSEPRPRGRCAGGSRSLCGFALGKRAYGRAQGAAGGGGVGGAAVGAGTSLLTTTGGAPSTMFKLIVFGLAIGAADRARAGSGADRQ